MTLYPQIRNVKKSNFIIKILAFISIIVSIICVVINVCTSTKYLWCLLVIVGIIYSWITVLYSIYRNVNIASNVTIQAVAISLLTLCIDFIIGYKGWAINIAIPIIIMVANVTILVLTFVSVNRYYKYAIYQLLIFILSIIPLMIYYVYNGIIIKPIFMIISSSIAVFTFIISLILCGKNIMEELDRRLHL